MKQCTHCKITKSVELFSFSNKSKGKRKSRCKSCISIIEKESQPWKKRKRYKGGVKKEKRFSSPKEAHLWYTYNLTLDDFNNIKDAQDGKCAICRSEPKLLVVDHCHESGKVRGLLCHNCNIGLGLLGDTKESLSKAYKYLS